MPKYWGKQILAHGRFPEVGQIYYSGMFQKNNKRLKTDILVEDKHGRRRTGEDFKKCYRSS